MEKLKTKDSAAASKGMMDFRTFVNMNKYRLNNNTFLSFAFPINNMNLISILNSINKKYKDVLFYRKAQDNYSFIAINRLIELPSDNSNLFNFTPVITDINSHIVNNWANYNLDNLPIITGGVNFDENNFSDEWDDFRVNNFFIPGLIIFQNRDKTYIIYNHKFYIEEDIDNIFINFNQLVSSILSLNNIGNINTTVAIKKIGEYKTEEYSWINLISKAKRYLKNNLNKIVLSRRIQYKVNDEINWTTCMQKLDSDYQECYLYMIKSNGAIFFGASPEKFISAQNKRIELDAMAGSAPTISQDIKTTLMNNKNLKEHKFVTDFIENTLSIYTDEIIAKKNPTIIKLSNVQHLYTKISARLYSENKVFKLMGTLFPTPAVCGLPKDKAQESIRKLEKFDRGLYSGLVGWISLEMNCEFAVAIRSALCKDEKLYIYAGAGIVEESDPKEEFFETELKFKTILNLFDEQKAS
ncbi:MAG: isochorismate synthase [Ignavibacteria bacterium]|nr:isochorismate synthase [Ignavibacteria bacterium]